MGMERFIARDFASWGELLDPAQLLPLVGQVDIPELLGQHHARLARRWVGGRLGGPLGGWVAGWVSRLAGVKGQHHTHLARRCVRL
jgi:hypothetical protein